jgi:hypothetical protein
VKQSVRYFMLNPDGDHSRGNRNNAKLAGATISVCGKTHMG